MHTQPGVLLVSMLNVHWTGHGGADGPLPGAVALCQAQVALCLAQVALRQAQLALCLAQVAFCRVQVALCQTQISFFFYSIRQTHMRVASV